MAREMIHGLKYNYIESLAALLAEDIALLLKQDVADSTDKKVPASAVGAGLLPAFAVPLHPSRLKQRGFNQAELILDATGWARGEGHLRRIRKTESQVGKRARDRVRNVGGAFAYDGPSLKGVTVVLIDDVITTGATANECARTLKDHGAQSVWGVAFARASHDPAKPGSPIAD